MRRSTIFEFLNRQPAVLSGKKVRLRPRKTEDCANVYRWRTDEELCRLDATIPISLPCDEFPGRYSIELEYPGLTYTLAIESFERMHIGECSLFNINFIDNSTEIGILIGEKACWDKGFGSDAIETFVQHIFEASAIEVILLRTLDWNIRAHKCFEKCGFTFCGDLTKEGYHFLVMERRRLKSREAV